MLQDEYMAGDKTLEEKEELFYEFLSNGRYRKFIQGVIHNDGLLDAEDNDDEDYIPDPIDDIQERVHRPCFIEISSPTRRVFHKQKSIRSATYPFSPSLTQDRALSPIQKPIKPRPGAMIIVPSPTPRHVKLNSVRSTKRADR